MKVRVVIEYDIRKFYMARMCDMHIVTEETLEYERKAWIDGDVGVPDIIAAGAGTVQIIEATS